MSELGDLIGPTMRCAFPGCDIIEWPAPTDRNVCRKHEELIGKTLMIQRALEEWEPREFNS